MATNPGESMASKTCARCGGATRKPATQTARFAVDNDRYEIDLCDQHAAQLDRELGGWVRLARDVTPASTVQPGRLSITAERERTQPPPLVPTRIGGSSAFIPKDLQPGVVHVQKLPPGYHDWRLTEHALQRCEQRGIAQRDALIAASDPQLTYPTKQDPAEWFHIRGPIACVVNAATKEVITVMHQSELETEGKEAG
jgi:hypothetical protein